MGRDSRPVGPPNRHEDPDGDGLRVPPTRPSHLLGETTLSVDPADQVIHVDDVGLQFDHEQRSAPRTPRKDVDDPTLPIDREGDLRLEDPIREVATEHPGDLLVQGGMLRIDEAVEVTRTPPREEFDPDVEGGRNAPDDGQ